MRAKDWKPNTRVFIVSEPSLGADRKMWNGWTTARPPYRDGDITRADIIDDNGSPRAIAIGRIKYVTDCV
jgi:hypothetical protein